MSTLLYCWEDEAEEILDTTRISAENKLKYRKVMEEFDNYFQVRKNVIFERACFNKRNQLSDEPVEEFIAEIHRLADRCDFKNMKDELIHDRLVVGIRDNALSEHLQVEPELTLGNAKRLIRQREAIKEQQETLRKPNKGEGALDSVVRQVPRRKLPAILQEHQCNKILDCADVVEKTPTPNNCVPLKKL